MCACVLVRAVTLRNKFHTLRETSERLTPNDKYENFVTDNIETVNCSLGKIDNMKKSIIINKRNSIYANKQKKKKNK